MEDLQLLELVRKAQLEDRQAFGELAREFQPMVFAIVLRRLRNRSEALEVTQEVFIRAMRKLSQLRHPERFVGWLKRIAIRMAINAAVRRPQETAHDPQSFAMVEARRKEAPLEGMLRAERAFQLRGGLSRLRRMDREALIAFYFKGESLKEISSRLQRPIGTIKRRLHTARNRLKDQILELQPA